MQQAVHAFYQWTIDEAGRQKARNDIHDTLKADDDSGRKFHVFGGTYTFDCEIDDHSQMLRVTMKNSASDSVRQNPSKFRNSSLGSMRALEGLTIVYSNGERPSVDGSFFGYFRANERISSDN